MSKIAKDILANFPEAAVCVSCVGWKSDGAESYEWIWIAQDEELEERDYIIPITEVDTRNGKDKVYVITPAMLSKAMPGFLTMWKDKGWGMYGAKPSDPDTWDAVVYDAAIQFVLFGDLILG